MKKHPVITKDYPENLLGGIMICGINFGYSKEDALAEARGEVPILNEPSFFSDRTVNNARFANRVITWLASWGFPLARERGKEGHLEKLYFQTNWLDTQTHTAGDEGKVRHLVQHAEGILSLISTRQPRTIVFVGNNLIEALNDGSIRERVEGILGDWPGAATSHTGVGEPSKTQFRVRLQRYPATQIISLPHPQTHGLSDAYMASFRGLLAPLLPHVPIEVAT